MGIRRSRFCGALSSPSQPAIPRPTCAREPAPLRSEPARSRMKRTRSRPHLPGATDATSADFPRAVCRRKALERSGGVVTPPHSAGMYNLFGFFLFGIFFASSCSRRCSRFAVPCMCLCECVCLWGGGCGGAVRAEPCAGLRVHAALPSRSQAAGRALAGLQSYALSSSSCLAFAFACMGLVLSRCVALVS